MAEGDTLVNALVGAVVGAVLSPIIPFAPLAGGAVSGYMEGGTRRDGLRVGALAGLIAFVPVVLIAGVVFLLFGTFFFGVGAGEAVGVTVVGGVIVFLALAAIAVYVVGLSIAGGWVGNYIRYETDIGT